MRTTNRPRNKRIPLTFISHDSRDNKLAQEFCSLLQGASGGNLRLFSSSDHTGLWGIEHGSEWYRNVMERLHESTTVIALLTRRSLDRPWILYEAGVAKGRDALVLGVALGLSLQDVSSGPFSQFQNCSGDEDSLTRLVMDLICRCHNGANPSDKAVRHWVQEFLRELSRAATVELAESHIEDRRIDKDLTLIVGSLRDDGYFKLLGPKLCEEFPLISQSGGGYDPTG